MSAEYSQHLATQVAELSINRFSGVPDAQFGHPDTGHFEGAGVIMATLITRQEDERFLQLVNDLSANKEYQAYALAHALEYCNRDMLQPVFRAIDTIEPATLPIETRATLMAAIAKALLREDGDPGDAAWDSYRISADDLFDETTHQPYVDPSTVSDVMHASRFTDIPDTMRYVGYITATVDNFIHSPSGQRAMNTGFGTIRVGETVAMGALHALDALGFSTNQKQLMDSLTRDPAYSVVVVSHVESLLRADKQSGADLYGQLQSVRADIAHMQTIDVEHAKYLARHGDTERALAFAESLPVYTDRVWIMLAAARTLAKQGERGKAVATVQAAADLDPLAIEPHRPETEPYEDVYEDMPEVDEDDLASMDKFNDEAGMRSQLQQKDTYDLRTERGYTLESVAEAAAEIGDYDLAVRAYGQSRQYPMQTELRLAETAEAQGRMHHYVRAILAGEALDDIIKPRVLEAALAVFHARADRFDDNGTGAAIETEIQQLVRTYVAERVAGLSAEGRLDNLSTPPLAELLVQCGDYKQALGLLKDQHGYRVGEVVSQTIRHKAYSGLTADAAALYVHSPSRPTESLSRDRALRAIIVNSLIVGDEDSARMALLEVPDYSQRTMLGGVMREIGDLPIETPDWIIAMAMGPEKYSPTTDVKAIASAIKRAELVRRRAQ